ncbi:hypothetical protein COS78_00155 [Candidatus Shapirobacteria bacterium CG06_land_8_20_14_3_00_40_12]|uniref:CAAX prenyl protease 2/Lysostaphin resistance protein A-like domain-containing protein n=1 Tax=Candidatus Shapirobacteria bacterium CG06_land_8_20_14_3_00_40_12 TaxID=1974881 RepID=A0A2M7ATB1_9BACT|nr:MAG: hypothetical protein COS78_00155 [Candidatus Shapirobacteria bacterium CG06_land_8_20_14_3_00_40_12]
MLKKLVANKYYFLAELLLLVLITLNRGLFTHQNYQIRLTVYLVSIFYLVFILKFTGFPTRQLGLQTENFVKSIGVATPTLILYLISLFLVYSLWTTIFDLGIDQGTISSIILRMLAYVFISVPVQEIVFRSYVIHRLKSFSSKRYFLIIISSLIFAYAHWPFGNILLTIGSFFFGIYAAVSFLRFRNIFTVMVLHAIVGLTLMLGVLQ